MLTEESTWKWIIGLSILGIILALYLLYNYYSPVPSTICDISGKLNCGAIAKGGTLSTFLGIPVAAIGLTGYIVILISSIVKNKKLLFAMAAFGTVFCLRITFLELFVVKIICPVCLACQIVMLLVFLLSIYLLRQKSPKTELAK